MRELPEVRRTQPITVGQHYFNNPCPIATMWLHGKQQQQRPKNVKIVFLVLYIQAVMTNFI